MKNIYSAFDVAKLKRFLLTHGEMLQFQRFITDDFEEPTNEIQNLNQIKGVTHKDVSYISKNISDGTQSRIVRQPKVLVLIDENSRALTMGDFYEYDGMKYQIIAKEDLGDFGSVYDISLELVDNGR